MTPPPLDSASMWLVVMLPYAVVLVLVWVLLAGQPSAPPEYAAKMEAQQTRIAVQQTQIAYFVAARATPTSIFAPARKP